MAWHPIPGGMCGHSGPLWPIPKGPNGKILYSKFSTAQGCSLLQWVNKNKEFYSWIIKNLLLWICQIYSTIRAHCCVRRWPVRTSLASHEAQLNVLIGWPHCYSCSLFNQILSQIHVHLLPPSSTFFLSSFRGEDITLTIKGCCMILCFFQITHYDGLHSRSLKLRLNNVSYSGFFRMAMHVCPDCVKCVHCTSSFECFIFFSDSLEFNWLK